MPSNRDFSEMREISGLKELRAELRQGGPEMAKRLQAVNKKLVSEVAERARARMYATVATVDPSHRPVVVKRPSGRGSIGRTRASIRAQAGQLDARVVAGGPKAEGFYGHEFGGAKRPTTMMFPQHKGREGYVLYPTVREEIKHVEDDWNRIFDEVFPAGGGA